MAFSAGDVVLVPFPYRDRLAERARPAVVVSAAAYNRLGDVVLAAVTSHLPRLRQIDPTNLPQSIRTRLLRTNVLLPYNALQFAVACLDPIGGLEEMRGRAVWDTLLRSAL